MNLLFWCDIRYYLNVLLVLIINCIILKILLIINDKILIKHQRYIKSSKHVYF